MTINPKGYIVLLLDKNPEQVSRQPFKLKKEKGLVALYDQGINQIDLLIYQNQSKGFAIGRNDLNNTHAFFIK